VRGGEHGNRLSCDVDVDAENADDSVLVSDGGDDVLVIPALAVDGELHLFIHDLACNHPQRLAAGELEGEVVAIETEALANFGRTDRYIKDISITE